MAKKVKEPVEPKSATDEKKEETTIETPAQETKQEEVVVGREFAIKGELKKETHTLRSEKVFEIMTGQFRTVWVKE